MKKNKFLLYFFVLILILTFNFVSANSIVPVSSCGTITQDTNVTNDVSSTGTCFTIGADNVVLDCQGYVIYYSSVKDGYGIDNSGGFDNIIVKNCRIKQSNYLNSNSISNYPILFGISIFLNNSDNSIIEYNNLTGGKAGIVIINSLNNIIRHNYGSYFEYGEATSWDVCRPFTTSNPEKYYESGIWLVDSNNAIIYNNTIRGDKTESGHSNHKGTEAGITLCRANYTSISDNTIYSVDTYGIHLTKSYNNNIFYNFINGSNSTGSANTNYGIILDASSENNNINYSEFYNCKQFSIFISDSNINTIYNNTANNCDDMGIKIGGTSSYNSIINNIINDNIKGIQIEGDYNYIEGNELLNNSCTGIRFYGFGAYTAANNIIINNKIETLGITAFGIEFFSDDGDNLIYNTLINSTNNDIHISGSGINNLTNCTFNKSDVGFSAGATGKIYMNWYMDVYVNDTHGNPINMAKVVITNVQGNSEISMTNESGFTETAILPEYFQNSTGKYFFSPYLVKASKQSYRPVYKQANLEYNEFIFLTLKKWLNISPVTDNIGNNKNKDVKDIIDEKIDIKEDFDKENKDITDKKIDKKEITQQ